MSDAIVRVDYTPATIEADFESMRARLEELMAPYREIDAERLAGTPMADLKRQRAYVNAVIRDVEDARKRIKAEYSRPLQEFEASVKELLAPAREAEALMKGAVDAKEAALREDRLAQLERTYLDMAPALAPVVPFERLMDAKWATATGYRRAIPELEERVRRIASDWEALKSQRESLEFYDEAEKELFRTLDLSSAIRANAQRCEERDRIEAMRAEVEENRAAMAAEEPCEAGDAERDAYLSRVGELCERGRENGRAVQRSQEAAEAATERAVPCVMVIGAATRSQMLEIGRFCGSIGVHGKFIAGTLEQACAKDRRGE